MSAAAACAASSGGNEGRCVLEKLLCPPRDDAVLTEVYASTKLTKWSLKAYLHSVSLIANLDLYL